MTLRQQTCGLVEQNMLIFHGALVKIICFFSQMILLNLNLCQVQSIWMVTFSPSGERSASLSQQEILTVLLTNRVMKFMSS